MDKSKILNVISPLAFILVFSALSTFVPREYFSLVFAVYLIAIFAVMMIVPRIMAKKRGAKIMLEGSVLMRAKQKEVLELASRDKMLTVELKSQTMRMFGMMFLPILIWFAVSVPLFSILIPSSVPRGTLEMFLRYVAFYTILFGLMYALRFVLTPKKMVIPVFEFEIRESGVIGSGGLAIPFPLDTKRYEVAYDMKRGFVEIYDKRSKQAFRFYANDVYKLKSIIERYALREQSGGSTR